MVHRKADIGILGSSNTQATLPSKQSPKHLMEMNVHHITPVSSHDSSLMNRRKWDVRDLVSPTLSTFTGQGMTASSSGMSPTLTANTKVRTAYRFLASGFVQFLFFFIFASLFRICHRRINTIVRHCFQEHSVGFYYVIWKGLKLGH